MIHFNHADLLDPEAGHVQKNRFVLVDGGTVREVSDRPPQAPGARVIDLVRCLPAHGVAMLMVEQRLRQTLAIRDRDHIFDQGNVVMQGRASDLPQGEGMVRIPEGKEAKLGRPHR